MARFVALLTFGDSERRLEVLPEHRAYLGSLLTQGKLHESGPFADQRGAMIIYEADDETAARALIDADPYSAAGVLSEVIIREWNRVLPAEKPA